MARAAGEPPRGRRRPCGSTIATSCPLAGAGDLLQAGPLLVRGGEIVYRDGVDARDSPPRDGQFDSDITEGRHPRAAIGVTDGELLALVADGRSDEDAGLTLGELATAMADLGARAALNLDGGGSASLVCDGRLRNRPRESTASSSPADGRSPP